MRLYFYISEVVAVNQLSKIVALGRKNNAANNITGVISYNNGYYLQVIEGDNEAIAQLHYNLFKDNRHKNIQTILDINVNHRYFSHWGLKLVPTLANDKAFEIFIKLMAIKLDKIPASKQALLKNFYDWNGLTDKVKGMPEWESTGFIINQWPNFSNMIATQNLMKLCGALMKTKVGYQELCCRKYYASETELQETLQLLRDDGCLAFLTQEELNSDDAYIHDQSKETIVSKMKKIITDHLH